MLPKSTVAASEQDGALSSEVISRLVADAAVSAWIDDLAFSPSVAAPLLRTVRSVAQLNVVDTTSEAYITVEAALGSANASRLSAISQDVAVLFPLADLLHVPILVIPVNDVPTVVFQHSSGSVSAEIEGVFSIAENTSTDVGSSLSLIDHD